LKNRDGVRLFRARRLARYCGGFEAAFYGGVNLRKRDAASRKNRLMEWAYASDYDHSGVHAHTVCSLMLDGCSAR
jgi:hypothetical protein